ncbi:MAG: zinc ribbon domain-containing protein [Anaerolineae bacterium]|nr:zinc ribbon domain-containing protein [Anaerolineae bacterium]NUQ06169.1 zinc ribbon domain-containing protein [Anaerolineae bacterium]
MPVYDYRCNACGRRSALTFKTISAYDAARRAGMLACPHCASGDLTRLISRVAIAKPSKNYAAMGSDEMLNVLEGGNSREVGEMFQQVGGDEALSDPQMAQVTERLLRGDSPERIEADIGGSTDADA